MTAKPKKKRKPLTWWQKAAFNAPLNPPRNTEKVIPMQARMGIKGPQS